MRLRARLRREERDEGRQALAVFLVGAVLTATVTWLVADAAATLRERRLAERVDALGDDIERLVGSHTAVLHGLRSLHGAGGLSRARFHAYVEAGGLADQYPGAQAFELARRVAPAEVPAFERAVRSDTSVEPGGYPGFVVHPEADVDAGQAGSDRDLWVVDYVEPMGGNEAAFGLDLAAEGERREALEAAVDRGLPRTTAPLASRRRRRHGWACRPVCAAAAGQRHHGGRQGHPKHRQRVGADAAARHRSQARRRRAVPDHGKIPRST